MYKNTLIYILAKAMGSLGTRPKTLFFFWKCMDYVVIRKQKYIFTSHKAKGGKNVVR